MDGFMNVLKKRGLIFKISTWVCAGLVLLGTFLPHAVRRGDGLYLFELMVEAIDNIEQGSALSYVMKLLVFVLILIGLAIVVGFYNRASFAISIVLISSTFVAGLLYLGLFSSLGESYARQVKAYKSLGGRMMDIFLIFLLIVSMLSLAAEIYVKVSEQKLGVAAQGGKGWFCPQCGQSNAIDAKFCNRCGSAAPISKSWFCPQCGTQNEASGKFCNKCGTKKPE